MVLKCDGSTPGEQRIPSSSCPLGKTAGMHSMGVPRLPFRRVTATGQWRPFLFELPSQTDRNRKTIELAFGAVNPAVCNCNCQPAARTDRNSSQCREGHH